MENTTEEQLRAEWVPIIKKVLYDYTGSAAGEITCEVIDSIMPVTREIINTERLKTED